MIFIRLKTSSQMVNRVEGNEMESPAAVGRGARRPRQSLQAPAVAMHCLNVPGQAMPTAQNGTSTRVQWACPASAAGSLITCCWDGVRSWGAPTCHLCSCTRSGPHLPPSSAPHGMSTSAEHLVQVYPLHLKNRALPQTFFTPTWYKHGVLRCIQMF